MEWLQPQTEESQIVMLTPRFSKCILSEIVGMSIFLKFKISF